MHYRCLRQQEMLLTCAKVRCGWLVMHKTLSMAGYDI